MEVIKISSKRRYIHLLLKLLPVILLIVFILIMKSGTYLKQPRNESEAVYSFFLQTSTFVEREEWTKAKKAIIAAETGWRQIAKRIQFSTNRSQMREIEIKLIKIKTYIEMKDKQNALIEISEAKYLWTELGR